MGLTHAMPDPLVVHTAEGQLGVDEEFMQRAPRKQNRTQMSRRADITKLLLVRPAFVARLDSVNTRNSPVGSHSRGGILEPER